MLLTVAGGSGDVGCGVRGDTQERIVGGQVQHQLIILNILQ
jgi:hypothetical protein